MQRRGAYTSTREERDARANAKRPTRADGRQDGRAERALERRPPPRLERRRGRYARERRRLRAADEAQQHNEWHVERCSSEETAHVINERIALHNTRATDSYRPGRSHASGGGIEDSRACPRMTAAPLTLHTTRARSDSQWSRDESIGQAATRGEIALATVVLGIRLAGLSAHVRHSAQLQQHTEQELTGSRPSAAHSIPAVARRPADPMAGGNLSACSPESPLGRRPAV